MVYDDAEVLYAEVQKEGLDILEEAFGVILPKSLPLSLNTDVKSITGAVDLVAFNTTFFPRLDVIQIPLIGAHRGLKSHVLQTSNDGSVGYALMHCPSGGSVGALSTSNNGLYGHLLPASGM